MSFAGTVAAQAADNDDEMLIKALAGAKITLLEGIAQIVECEVRTEAKYDMEKGNLILTLYTSPKGFDAPAEDNSFNKYSGDAIAAAWTTDKEAFADLRHIARSAQWDAGPQRMRIASSFGARTPRNAIR